VRDSAQQPERAACSTAIPPIRHPPTQAASFGDSPLLPSRLSALAGAVSSPPNWPNTNHLPLVIIPQSGRACALGQRVPAPSPVLASGDTVSLMTGTSRQAPTARIVASAVRARALRFDAERAGSHVTIEYRFVPEDIASMCMAP